MAPLGERLVTAVRRLMAALFLGLTLFSLAGCNNEPERPVIIGTNIWLGYEPGYLADRQHLYGDADVNLRQYQSATQVLRAFRNKAIDVAALSLDEALVLRQSGIPIRIFLVTDTSDGADAILAKPGIASIRDLAGKRIGVENSALGDYVLARALQIHGLKDSAIQEVSLTVDETEEFYTAGKVDAVVTFEPFKSKLIAAGAHEIFNSRQMPGEIVDVLVVRDDFANENPNVLRAVAAGWMAAADILNRRQPEVIGQIAGRLGLDPAKVANGLSGLQIPDAAENHMLLDSESGQVAQAAAKLIPMLQVRHGGWFAFTPAELFTTDFLPDTPAR